MHDFQGKVAVVTGAASAIGKELAERCVQHGMKVALADIEEPALTQTCSELQAQGAKILAVVTDVSKATDVEELAQKTLDAFGGVHLLFNNAGVADATWTWQHTLADWEWILGVNLWGVIHGIRVFVPVMLEQDVDCHIINTSSIAGLAILTGQGIYTATKFAMVSLSETLFHELRKIGAKVKVSVLCPGAVRTRIQEAARNRPANLPETDRDTTPGRFDELDRQAWQRLSEEAIEPQRVADAVFEAIRDERFYILTHPQYNDLIRVRMEDILQGRNPTNPWTVLLSGNHRLSNQSQGEQL